MNHLLLHLLQHGIQSLKSLAVDSQERSEAVVTCSGHSGEGKAMVHGRWSDANTKSAQKEANHSGLVLIL